VSACNTPYGKLCHDLQDGVHRTLRGLTELVRELSADLVQLYERQFDSRGRCRVLGLGGETAGVNMCYLVSFGIQTCGTWAGATVRSQVTVQRMAGTPYPKPTTDSALDVTLSGPSCRDGRLLAVMMVDAVMAHALQRHAQETDSG
jgi:hypothetical protein